tara:strand:+ start:411 stop:536 length:126 start_codon:yes stop_codon:yes gene_type:complete
MSGFGFKNQGKYANYLSLYCPFAGIKKAQGANHFWLTPWSL